MPIQQIFSLPFRERWISRDGFLKRTCSKRPAGLAQGFGCEVIAYDLMPPKTATGLAILYLPLDDVIQRSDILLLQPPLTQETRHIIDAARIEKMKRGTIVVNTERGAFDPPPDLPAEVRSV
ncbi:hypothetical protein OO012_05625 [Rhodobacteraceae bacterium KMM 6894]|nr:hypothetical protein [Rhodobacteraceae bacterium KMM 6894]